MTSGQGTDAARNVASAGGVLAKERAMEHRFGRLIDHVHLDTERSMVAVRPRRPVTA